MSPTLFAAERGNRGMGGATGGLALEKDSVVCPHFQWMEHEACATLL